MQKTSNKAPWVKCTYRGFRGMCLRMGWHAKEG